MEREKKVLFKFSDPADVKLKQAFVPILVPKITEEGKVEHVRLVFRFDFLTPSQVQKVYRSNLFRPGDDGNLRMFPPEAALAVAKEFVKEVEGYEPGLDLAKLFDENDEAKEHAIGAASHLCDKFAIREAEETAPLPKSGQ